MGATLAFALAVVPAAAQNISIGLTARAEVQGGTLNLGLEILNSGEEAAYSLSPSLHFRGEETRGEVFDILGPDMTWETGLSLPTGELGRGRWPYRVVLNYEDANEYRFHALHVATVEVKGPPPANRPWTVGD